MRILKFNEAVEKIDDVRDNIGDIFLDLKDIGIEYNLKKCWVNPKTFNDEGDVYSFTIKEVKGFHLSYRISFDLLIDSVNNDRQKMIAFFQELKNVEDRLKHFGKVKTLTELVSFNDTEGFEDRAQYIHIDIMVITEYISNLNQSNEEIIKHCIDNYCHERDLHVSFSSVTNHFWVVSNQHMKESQFNKIAMQIYRDVEALCKGKIKISFDEIGIVGTKGNCVRMKIDE